MSIRQFSNPVTAAVAMMLAFGCAHEPKGGLSVDWPAYGGETPSRYSGLAQINTRNVASLKQVWRFDAGTGGLQTSPLVALLVEGAARGIPGVGRPGLG